MTAHTLHKRGYHAVYRENERNFCPGCSRTHWLIGRMMAECGFCGTALPLANSVRAMRHSAAALRPSGLSRDASQAKPAAAIAGKLRELVNAGDDACLHGTPMIPLHRDTIRAILFHLEIDNEA
jgi:hypothetical protein